MIEAKCFDQKRSCSGCGKLQRADRFRNHGCRCIDRRPEAALERCPQGQIHFGEPHGQAEIGEAGDAALADAAGHDAGVVGKVRALR